MLSIIHFSHWILNLTIFLRLQKCNWTDFFTHLYFYTNAEEFVCLYTLRYAITLRYHATIQRSWAVTVNVNQSKIFTAPSRAAHRIMLIVYNNVAHCHFSCYPLNTVLKDPPPVAECESSSESEPDWASPASSSDDSDNERSMGAKVKIFILFYYSVNMRLAKPSSGGMILAICSVVHTSNK